MHEFIDESFDLDKSHEYILSIQVCLNGFSFSIVKPSESKLVCFKSTTLKISSSSLLARRFNDWVKSNPVLMRPYLKIRGIIFSEKFTLVPEPLYHRKFHNEITHILFEDSNKLHVAENVVKKLNAKLLFDLPDQLPEILKRTIGECEIIHPVKLLINHLKNDTEDNTLTLLFNAKNMYFVLTGKETLIMANSYQINHPNDVLYFALTAPKQLNINPKSTHLLYSGKPNFKEEIDRKLENYFLSARTITTDKLKYPEKLNNNILNENMLLFL